MVMDVLNAPVAAVVKEKVEEPAVTVPVVETLNPVPLTVTAEPAGPVAGLREIWAAAGAAWTGWTAARVSPKPTTRAVTRVFTILNKAIPAIGRWPGRPQISSVPTGTCPDPKTQTAESHQDLRKFF
jgi:hypothetical protein